jgi:ABC-type transport system involved in multi-copper enzyme maturation permease subunit
MSAALATLRTRLPRLRLPATGIGAIGVKELRGRMRGRRAFVVLTVYLVLLAAFAAMMELDLERTVAQYGTQPGYAASMIGRGVFTSLLLLETLLVIVLVPAFTAGAISLEREKQTLDMLATTPISSTAIVVGKLLTALVYVFLLVLASVPLSALVFVFGGVAPDDLVRGYVVLLVTAVGLGSLALFFSALVKRTQAATVLSYGAVLVATLGTLFVHSFWSNQTDLTVLPGRDVDSGGAVVGETTQLSGPPEALMYLNPYIAVADVVCGAGDWPDPLGRSGETFCTRVARVTGRDVFGWLTPTPVEPVNVGVEEGDAAGRAVIVAPGKPADDASLRDVVAVDQLAFGATRDVFWPKSIISWLVLSVFLTIASIQLVTPTRRWRPRLPGFLRRLTRRTAR